MKLHEAILHGERILHQNSIDQPAWNSERLLLLATKQTRSQLYAELNRELTQLEFSNFMEFLKKRAEHYPLAYLEGTQEFFGREFLANESVLIPRPETEELIHAVLELQLKHPKMLDLGSGSGAISVTLAREIPESTAVSLELSSSAIPVLRQNGATLIVRADFYSLCFLPQTFDLVTANLPYVESADYDDLPAETKWEPRSALVPASLEQTYWSAIQQSIRVLKAGGFLVMEFGYGQKERLKSLVSKEKEFHLMEIRKDQRGIERVLVLQKRNGLKPANSDAG